MVFDSDNIRAIIFDVDGTLRDTDDQWVTRLTNLLRPVQFAFPEQNPRPFARRIIMGLEDPGNYLQSLSDRINIDHLLARLSDASYRLGLGRDSAEYALIPGVWEMLSRLQPYYRMAIVTVRGRRATNGFLEKFELTPFFEIVVTGQTCRHTKPYPDPILWAVKKMKLPPQACIMVGDTTVDIQAGRAAGVKTIGVLCGFGEEGELIETEADLILPNTADLADILLCNGVNTR